MILVLEFRFSLSLQPSLPPPQKKKQQNDCGSSRSHLLIWLQCLLWWWTFKLSKSFVKYCLSTKSGKCQAPASSPRLHCSFVRKHMPDCDKLMQTCYIAPSWWRAHFSGPQCPPPHTYKEKKQQQKWLAEPNTCTSDVFYKHKLFR